ncbi:MAG: tyrosine-protein phosphatase [Defluviitaleaceae bacterium]|nr:tyrosine-protein phosphatase [Defluviitaleaceae bacterium]
MNKLVNFRDLGGIVTADGKKIRPKRLLRAGAPHKLMPEEIKMLQDHELALIVDFRSEKEVGEEPADEIEDVLYVNLDVMADKMSNWADPKEWMKKLNPDTADAEMMSNYKEFIHTNSSKTGFAEFIRILADLEEGSVLFHCAAGKDRTGFGAAVVLKILGVSDEDIYIDYMKTLKEREEANKIIIDKYRAMGLNEEQLTALTMMYGVKEDYLAAAFAVAEEEYGSFENYLSQGLGVSPADIARIRKFYLE